MGRTWSACRCVGGGLKCWRSVLVVGGGEQERLSRELEECGEDMERMQVRHIEIAPLAMMSQSNRHQPLTCHRKSKPQRDINSVYRKFSIWHLLSMAPVV